MRKSFYIVLLIFISVSVSAQKNLVQSDQIIKSLSNNDEPIILKFTVSTKEQINNDLTKILSIDNVKTLASGQGFEVTAYANQQQFIEFLTRNIPYQTITQSPTKAITMATTLAQMANWDRYPTYAVYEQMMANFALNYPNLCDIDTILSPTPSGNYRILVAKISDNVHSSENEPQFLYTSSMHGDETTGYILMLRLINYMLTNYGVLPKVTNLLNNVEIWINPLANPEGTYYQSNPVGSSVSKARRFNLSGVDLNRNYPDPLAGPHPDGLSWALETQAFMNFASSHHFNMSANFHGGAEVTNYPWDTWTTAGNPNADRLWWERVCTAYVDSARLITPTYMMDVTSDGVSEGGDWYVITGGRQDYMNYFKHCREVTIELDGTKLTPTENLNLKWSQNYRSLLNYIQEATYGVHGIITDSCSGQPLKAKVWVNNYDQINDSSQVYSALPMGNYYKYMIAGTYSITFSAPGYTSKTITGVQLNNGSATILNVQLVPITHPVAQFTGVQTGACTGTVQFTNTSTESTSFLWYFGDGSTSTQVNPTHSYTSNGTYTIKLKVYNCKSSDSLVRTNYITINLTGKVLNGKVFLESLYNGSSLMEPVKGISGNQFGADIADQLTVELHNSTAPYNTAYTFQNVNLNTNGTFVINTIPCEITGSYYLVVKHRNSIETWSNAPVNFGISGPITYDFSTSATQAYGSNLKLINTIWSIWGGDASHDGVVDGTDMSLIDNASTPPPLTGYNPQDVDGDGFVDGSDMEMIDNNSTSPAVQVKRP